MVKKTDPTHDLKQRQANDNEPPANIALQADLGAIACDAYKIEELVADLLQTAALTKSARNKLNAALSLAGSIQEKTDAAHTHLEAIGRDIFIDALTGVFNRKAFDIDLGKLIQQAPQGQKFSLITFDIDHFKAVNDTYGHASGDTVLRIFARQLQQNLKDGDAVYRTGGEEFCVIVKDAPDSHVYKITNRLRDIVARRPALAALGDKPFAPRITTSAGVAHYKAGESAQAFCKRADTALYAAKKAGRNIVVVSLDGPVPARTTKGLNPL